VTADLHLRDLLLEWLELVDSAIGHRRWYWLFARLAEGRSSVTIVANGGGMTLTEVGANVMPGDA
jgi:hypothetical protein